MKAIAPSSFRRHIQSFEWVPSSLLPAATPVVTALETGLGVALMVSLAQGIMLPTTIALLGCLSAVSWWGVKTGKASDCGCYGGFIQPSIWQSLGLNGIYALLLVPSWVTNAKDSHFGSWQAAAALGVAAGAVILTVWAERYEARSGRPLFNTNPIKVGAKWKHRWAHNATSELDGEFLVTMMGPDCPYCKQWVRVGNMIDEASELPPVIGVIAANKEKVASFINELGVKFPIAVISPSLMDRLAQAVPTTVHVVSGRIVEIWVGTMSPDFVNRFRRAFFPDPDQAPRISS